MPIETGILEPGMSGTPSLQWNRDDEGIVTLTLSGPDPETRGGVVVMDQWLLDSLCAALDQVEQSDPTGLILKSASNRVFVAGADLVEIDKLDDEALHAYLEQGASALHRINKLPCPSVCLINGAALGGGLEIAMHCDALVGVQPAADRKPYQVGLPEASLGLCPGWGGTQMLPARMDIYDAICRTARGQTWGADEHPDGFLDVQVEQVEHLDEAARNWIRENRGAERSPFPRCLQDIDRDTLEDALDRAGDDLEDTETVNAVLQIIRIGMELGWEAGVAEERRALVHLRGTDDARSRLEKFFARH
ncbi:MAG: hypothetical protein CMJ32_12250 [Phycisphaerae bacterium]|nr:hypothetical protein [Phycisphaerae bacterium]